jgi:hypothetical protein
MPQVDCSQTPLPFGGARQAVPHDPQFCASLVRSTQLPLQISPGHVAWQLPVTQN